MAHSSPYTNPDLSGVQNISNPNPWNGSLDQSFSPVTLESLAKHLPETPKKSLEDLAALHLGTIAEKMLTDPASDVDIQQEPVAQSTIPSFGNSGLDQFQDQGLDYNPEQPSFAHLQSTESASDLNTLSQPATPTFFNLASQLPQVNQPATIFQQPVSEQQATGPTFDPFVYQLQQPQASFDQQPYSATTGGINREMAQNIPRIESPNKILNFGGNSKPTNPTGVPKRPGNPAPTIPEKTPATDIVTPLKSENVAFSTSGILKKTIKPGDTKGIQSFQKLSNESRKRKRKIA